MGTPAISVIMPVYNTGPLLRPAVESVLAQTWRDFELLLVDDGSTDGSGEVCDEYAARDGRIRVLHGRNGGICASRNVGLGQARGTYVAFVDHDDFCEPEMLALAALRTHGVPVVKFNHCEYRRHPDGSVCLLDGGLSRSDALWEIGDLFTRENYPLYQQLAAAVWNGVYSRAAIEAVGLRFDEGLTSGGEDCLFMARLLASVRKGAWLSRPLYRHYHNDGSSTSSGCHPNLADDYLRIAREERELFPHVDPSVRFLSFLRWAHGLLQFVFLAKGCPFSRAEQVARVNAYAAELLGDASVPWWRFPPKNAFFYLCLRLRCVGLYLAVRRFFRRGF